MKNRRELVDGHIRICNQYGQFSKIFDRVGLKAAGVKPFYANAPGDPRRVVLKSGMGLPEYLRFCVRRRPFPSGAVWQVEDQATGERSATMSRELAYWTAAQIDAAYVRHIESGEPIEIL